MKELFRGSRISNWVGGLWSLACDIHALNCSKGFHGPKSAEQREAEECLAKLALIVSEVAEAMETVRKPPEASWKLQGFTAEAEEIADILIRVLDYAAWRGIDLMAVEAKLRYNEQRPPMHGKLV